MRSKVIATTIALSCSFCTLQAQNATATVEVNPSTKRYFGEVTTLNRRTYVGMHTVETSGKNPIFEKFKQDYNLGDDYIGSRRFSYPITNVKEGKIPQTKKRFSGRREVYDFIGSSSPTRLFYDKTINYAEVDYAPYLKKLSNYIAASLRDDWEIVPKYLEPMNEPMIHAPDVCKSVKGADKRKAIDAVITNICKYHRDLGRAVHNTPELANVEVLGFGSAFPEFESNNFALWESRFKQFIDIAGEDIDVLSFHLYDGSGVNNAGGRRSGSNIEAIMDILQTYSYIKLGAPMPMAITEYGRLVPNEPAWEAQTGAIGNKALEGGPKMKPTVSNYNPVTNSQAVRSQLHMVTAFMNRPDEIVRTVPFTVGQSPQTTMYCKSSLWVKQADGTYEYSNRRFFFEMLKDLKGDNAYVKSSNVDIQTLALVDGDELYLMLNNLGDATCDVALNNMNTTGLKSVDIKTLKIFNDRVPECKVVSEKRAPQNITLEYGETAVLTYRYKQPIKTTSSVVRKKYFSKDYLKDIKANTTNKFSFEGVKSASSGDAILRLGVGRAHGLKVEPKSVKINGKEVAIKGDIIKGYDQNTRKQFFGALEIPFDITVIKDGTNSVEVSYAEDGGKISSVILQLQTKR